MNKNLLYRSIPKVDVLLESQTIQEMIEEEDTVTVPKLMQKTGLSRGFFYKNPEVRKAVDRALQLQAGMVDKRRMILDMDNRQLKRMISAEAYHMQFLV